MNIISKQVMMILTNICSNIFISKYKKIINDLLNYLLTDDRFFLYFIAAITKPIKQKSTMKERKLSDCLTFVAIIKECIVS